MTALATPILAYVFSFVLILWSTTVWVPRVVTRYGIQYFAWKDAWIPGFMMLTIALGVQMTFAYALMRETPYAAWPFAALMVVALNGVFQADARFQLIPDRFQIVGSIGALGYLLFGEPGPLDLTRLALHAASGPGLALLLAGSTFAYERVRKRDALGLGDIKLIAWLGLAFGPNVATILFGAMVLATIAVLPMLLLRRRSLRTTFAFGPFLVLGVGVQLFFIG